MLDKKVSRERIGKEVNGMICEDGYKTLYAFTLLYVFQLYDIVFEIPQTLRKLLDLFIFFFCLQN